VGDLFKQRTLQIGDVDLAAGGADVQSCASGAGKVRIGDDAAGRESRVVGCDRETLGDQSRGKDVGCSVGGRGGGYWRNRFGAAAAAHHNRGSGSAEAEHRGAGQKGTTVHNIVDELLSLFLNHDRIFLLNRFRLSPAHGQRVLPLVCTLYASGKEIGLKGN
jgi:hypothetical protein